MRKRVRTGGAWIATTTTTASALDRCLRLCFSALENTQIAPHHRDLWRAFFSVKDPIGHAVFVAFAVKDPIGHAIFLLAPKGCSANRLKKDLKANRPFGKTFKIVFVATN